MRSRKGVSAIYARLRGAYGPSGWWPAATAFEVCVGAILTQNTAWVNVERALGELRRRGLLSALALSRRSAAELTLLDAGLWFSPAFRGEKIPTLEQVLDWAADRLRVNIEIKSAAAGVAVQRLLRNFPRSRVLISSFDHRLLEQLRQQDATLPLGFLGETRFWRRGVRRAVAAGAESYHPRADRVSRPLLLACHSAGLAVYPWTVDAVAEVNRLLLLGVSGLFTNDPRRVVMHLESKQNALKLQEKSFR